MNNFRKYGALLLNKKESNKLTDTYFEYSNDIEPIKVRLFCIGPVKNGDYITTCPVFGVSMATSEEEVAIGYSETTKSEYKIGEINAVLFRE